jgi:peptidoglycan/LPS O-acetylase OafA/YrhL
VRIGKATDTRIDAIAWGALAAILTVHPSAGWYRRAMKSTAVLWASLGLLLFAGTSFARIPAIAYSRYLISGMALFFLVPSLVAQKSLLRQLLERSPVVWVGRLSYSIYLWHWGAICLSGLIPAPGLIRIIARVGLTVVFSLGSYYLLERPILRLRKHFGSKVAMTSTETQPAPSPVTVTAISFR